MEFIHLYIYYSNQCFLLLLIWQFLKNLCFSGNNGPTIAYKAYHHFHGMQLMVLLTKVKCLCGLTSLGWTSSSMSKHSITSFLHSKSKTRLSLLLFCVYVWLFCCTTTVFSLHLVKQPLAGVHNIAWFVLIFTLYYGWDPKLKD